MLEKARELHGFTNVWSQGGKMVFYDKAINRVNAFYDWNFVNVAGQIWE